MKRAAYKVAVAEARAEGFSPVYVDESGFASETLRQHGYAVRGVCVSDVRSSQHYRRTSLIAPRLDENFTAPLLFTGSCNADRFNAWLAEALCPHLTSKHLVIMDNARWHKTARTQELITSRGARLLYLPPYSPDLNPIEHDFANIKRRWQYKHHLSIEDIITTYK